MTEEELIHWIQYVQKKYITDDTDRMWVEQDKEDDRITWHSYRNRTYGYEYGKRLMSLLLLFPFFFF